MSIINTNNQESSIDKAIAKSLNKLIDSVNNITEFKLHTLKAISVLSTDKYFRKYLQVYVDNLKHIKRKHSSEVLTALKYLSNYIKSKENGILGNLFNRNKD